MIYPDTEGSDKARAIDRIGKQITANRHREKLTAAQHTRGVAQMLELGASITKVSKTLAMDKRDVKAQAAVGKAEAARAALDSGQLDLTQAAVVAEFKEAGGTEAVEKLLTTSSFDFDNVAERPRWLRKEREAYALAAAPFAEKGYTIFPFGRRSFRDEVFPAELVTADGDEVTPDMIAGLVHPAKSRWWHSTASSALDQPRWEQRDPVFRTVARGPTTSETGGALSSPQPTRRARR